MCSERQVPTLIQRFFAPPNRHVLNVGDWTLCVPLPNVVWMFNFIAHPGWTNSNPKKIPTSDFDCFDLVRFWARHFRKKYLKIHGGLFLKPFFFQDQRQNVKSNYCFQEICSKYGVFGIKLKRMIRGLHNFMIREISWSWKFRFLYTESIRKRWPFHNLLVILFHLMPNTPYFEQFPWNQ